MTGDASPAVQHHLANARSKAGAETKAQLVWILTPRLPKPEGVARTDESRPKTVPEHSHERSAADG